jgi:putative FmdB family regulatory protein
VPTYQYSCTECDHAFDQVQSFTEPSLTTCPRCEGRLRKVYNAVGVVFRGSGFYRNDSRTEAAKAAAKSDSSPDGAKAVGSEAKSSSTEAGASKGSGTAANGSDGAGKSSGSSGASTAKGKPKAEAGAA